MVAMNAFTQFGDTAHRKVKAKVDRQISALEKVRETRGKLSKLYRRYTKDARAAAFALPEGPAAIQFIRHFRRVDNERDLVALFEAQSSWLTTLPVALRWQVFKDATRKQERIRIWNNQDLEFDWDWGFVPGDNRVTNFERIKRSLGLR